MTYLTLDQWLTIAAVIAIPMALAYLLPALVTGALNGGQRRRNAAFKSALDSLPNDD